MIRRCERSAESHKIRIQDRKGTSTEDYMQSKSLSCHQKLQVKQHKKDCSSPRLSRSPTLFYGKKPISTSNSYSGVKTDHSPVRKFNVDQPTEIPKKSRKGHENLGAESNYINYLKTTTRYVGFKIKALKAVRNKMIFTINVNNGDLIRNGLVERGWVEKISPNITETNKPRTSKNKYDEKLERLVMSDLVNGYPANFIWDSRENLYYDNLENKIIDFCKIQDSAATDSIKQNVIKSDTFRNHFISEALWTTKQGLCKCAKKIEVKIDIPKTYMNAGGRDKKDFLLEYRLTACTSLLKWVLTKVANKVSIFKTTGNISSNVIIFAINRCKEYLFMKQNKEMHDNMYKKITTGQWNSFLNKYLILIAGEDVFRIENDHKLPLFIGYAKLLMKRIYIHRPQVSSDGYQNIWIMKPADGCLRKGIRMASNLNAINDWITHKSSNYLVQKYIEKPLLIHGTKFVIRQYYLVTSICPLVIWMYKDCYLKFSSQQYSLEVFHESIHFTNYAIQKKYENCANRHREIPKHNMWDLNTYKRYLETIGNGTAWEKLVYPGMKESIVQIMLGSQSSKLSDYSQRCFGLYGCDFIVDRDYRPWLIEIKSCCNPKLTTEVTAKFYPEVMQHVLQVVIDRARCPNADTGKFECVYPPSGASNESKTLVVPIGFVIPITDSLSSGKLEAKHVFSPKKSKILEQSIIDDNVCLDKETCTYDLQLVSSVNSLKTNVSKEVEDVFNIFKSDQSEPSGNIEHSPNIVTLSSKNLLKKANVIGTQFARLLLSYFLIHLQSVTGISTLPSIVLESQKLRDSLRLQMSSPSKLFAGYDTEITD